LTTEDIRWVLYAAIDIHKHVFQPAAVDSERGQVQEKRFPAHDGEAVQ
jgi:hypothetical protein